MAARGIGLYLTMILASTWRWGLLLKAQHLDFRFRSLTSSFLVATFFNNFLPSNIGGDVVRIADTPPGGARGRWPRRWFCSTAGSAFWRSYW